MKQLADHQLQFISKMKEHPSYAIFSEAGTGKTATALAYLIDSITDGTVSNALIIVPASLVFNWKKSIDDMRDFGFSEFDIEVLKECVTIVSYSSIWVRGVNKAIPRDEYNIPWDVIICDESHRLGDPSTMQTKAILKLQGARKYIMTGTPDLGQYVKLYGQLKFLDPTLWSSFKEFKQNAVKTYDFFKKPLTYDQAYCEAIKRKYGHAVRLIDCFDMPTCNEVTHTLPIAAKKIYKAFMRGDTLDYPIFYNNIGTLKLKTLQVVSGVFISKDEIGQEIVHTCPTTKKDLLLDIIDGSTSKIVITAKYRNSIHLISRWLAQANIKHCIFDGNSSPTEPQLFQLDPEIKVIIVQYQKAIGIDLFAAHTMIFYEPTFSALELEQAKARIFRKGQTRNCIYHYFETEGTLEEKISQKVRSGVDVSKEMLDKWIQELSEKL